MKNFILVLFVSLLLLGCASGGGISTSALTAALNGTEAIGDDIVEASVAKELAVIDGLKNRDNMRAKMHENSGFHLNWEVVKNDITINVPKELTTLGKDIPITITTNQFLPSVTFRGEPNFQYALPTKPSVHPVWEATTSIFTVLAKYGLIAYGLHELNSMVSSGYANAGSVYNGPVQGSFNTAGQSQTFSLMRDNIAPIITTNPAPVIP